MGTPLAGTRAHRYFAGTRFTENYQAGDATRTGL